jgi:biotin carboxylase
MRIAIVDGYSTGKILMEALRDRGAECIHIRSLSWLPETYHGIFTTDGYAFDLGHEPDPHVLAERLADLKVDRVVAGSECGVVLADTLTNLLELPGNDATAIMARRDKVLMANRVREAGLPVPFGREFATAEDAVSWFVRSDLTEAVAKPTRSLGTDNVHFCAGAEQLEAACRRILSARNLYDEPNTEVLVQERLRGVEYYLNTVSHEGAHRAAEIWRYIKTQGANRSLIYDFEEPVDPRSDEGAALRTFGFAVLDVLGIRTGAAHTEVMMTATGPVLIETGARMGGGTTPEIVEKFFGVSQTGLLAQALLDPDRLLAYTEEGLVSGYYLRKVAMINRVAGTVRPHDWLATVMALPTAVAGGAKVAAGTYLPVTADEPSSPGYVYLASADPEEVARDYRWLRESEFTGPYTT